MPCACDPSPRTVLASWRVSRALCSEFEICDTISSNTLRKLRLIAAGQGACPIVHFAHSQLPPNPSWAVVALRRWNPHQGTPEPQHRMEGLMAEAAQCSPNKGYHFSADRPSLHPQTQALTARRQNPRPSHLLLPGHTHVPGPFHPEDTVLSHFWVPTGRPCPRTCSSPQKDLQFSLQKWIGFGVTVGFPALCIHLTGLPRLEKRLWAPPQAARLEGLGHTSLTGSQMARELSKHYTGVSRVLLFCFVLFSF